MIDPAEYCRAIETYLCGKNEGHLVRIVGPAFEQVRGWAERGVPLKVAFRGIDRYCERYYAKGPRRRPVRIEFCEDDVLDAFDDWRRAMGPAVVSASDGDGPETEVPGEQRRKAGLASHIERAAARLTAARAAGEHSASFDTFLDGLVEELRGLDVTARTVRGDARARLIDRLAELDRTLVDLACTEVSPDTAESLRYEAAEELSSFGSRLSPEVRERAIETAYRRLVRESFGLPVIVFE